MGAEQSTTTESDAAQILEPGNFTVQVTEAGEKPVTKADKVVSSDYDRGREDARAEMQAALETVAAQVYDNIRDEIASIQKKHIAASTELVISIRYVVFVILRVFFF